MKEQIKSYFERFKTRDTVYEAKGKLFHDLGAAESYAGGGKVKAHKRPELTAKADPQETKEKEGE